MTHICVGKIIISGSDNGLSPDRRQAIIWTNAGLLSIEPLRTYFSENLIKIQALSLKKMHVKMSSAKWRPSCLGLKALRRVDVYVISHQRESIRVIGYRYMYICASVSNTVREMSIILLDSVCQSGSITICIRTLTDHFNDVTWESMRLKSPVTPLFVQQLFG